MTKKEKAEVRAVVSVMAAMYKDAFDAALQEGFNATQAITLVPSIVEQMFRFPNSNQPTTALGSLGRGEVNSWGT